ncbi:bifunctional nuclease family protein [Anaeromyxobacter dehalogenans]|uniref:BFN domain-containing protein n=1 Tax=Anaeromyxobacter dehalogenans (strain 2CP-C) TaxID=290397 RepID=Q2IIB7_ANADE|nr:bifunctional nuclease family protein [Anaeromyxobacter dehalogenans]ABC81395.1 hypothetical protein Adeh_1622 [Anaeromyxobacter dehalogenans 2CP-C]
MRVSASLSIPWFVLVTGLAGISAHAAAPPAARVELEVAGVLPMPEGAASILVLREKGAKNLLPLVVPGAQDQDLGRRLRADAAPGLLAETIRALGGRVREVEIASADEGPGGARVRLTQGARRLELPGAASESVALAVSAGAPIFTSRRVMDESGLSPEEVDRARERVAREGGEPQRM